MRYGVFMPKMRLSGRGFESPSGQITIFPKKYTRNVKSMRNAVKSTVTVIERYSMILRLKNVDSTLSFFECSSTEIQTHDPLDSFSAWKHTVSRFLEYGLVNE
jgi:hypothetical protein